MELKVSEIKEDGRASLAYAYDINNVYTAASQAISGVPYSCPFCGCPIHLVISKTGKRFFVRNPKHMHTNPTCITIESKGKEHTFADLDPEQFIMSLCHVTPRPKKTTPKDPDGIESGSPTKTPSIDDDFALVRFSSLKQIAEAGVDHLKAEDVQGSHRISDFIITYKYAEALFAQPDFTLGSRIVYARYSYSDSTTQSILFTLYTGNFSVRFRLLFTDIKVFKSIRDKFGTFASDANGRTKFQKYYDAQYVLIASDSWAHILTPRCRESCNPALDDYCNKCGGMYQAVYTNAKQLYLLPADH